MKINTANFQWSTNEQLWPFEKTKDGETLYCKEFNVGYLQSGSPLRAALGAIEPIKIWRYEARGISPSTNATVSIPFPYAPGLMYQISIQFYNGNIELETQYVGWSSYYVYVRLIYTK